ncbi:MAG: hypothetical protein KAJ18_07355 [Candidatus Omnitrophica bacterium]|nr:hypothetical protein [Candidatus Omnitrophota bacterium]
MIEKKRKIFPFVFRAMIISVLYWIYIGFLSQIIIFHDSFGYEQLGRLLNHQGWGAYFMSGPNREPIYPFLVSLAMRVGENFSVSYLSIQKIFQLGILFLTQILMAVVLKKLKVSDFFIALAVLYLGFSPAILNSALRLYSEIVAYPIVLLIVLLGARAWRCVLIKKEKKGGGQVVLSGLFLGLSFVAMTFVKGIFELVVPLMLFSMWICSFVQKDKGVWKRCSILILSVIVAFYGFIILYKLANKYYNGQFTLTNRGAYAFYGNTARRAEKLTARRLKTALAYSSGHEVCNALLDDEDCMFWHYSKSDHFGFSKMKELRDSGLNPEEVNKQLLRLSVQGIMQHPFQVTLLMGVESIKMFFWEFRSMAYVVYPDWVSNLYGCMPFNYGLSFLLALLSFLALLYVIKIVLAACRNISSEQEPFDEASAVLFFIVLLVIFYIFCHSFFHVLPRYSFPLVPLYLSMIAFSLQQIFNRAKK